MSNNTNKTDNKQKEDDLRSMSSDDNSLPPLTDIKRTTPPNTKHGGKFHSSATSTVSMQSFGSSSNFDSSHGEAHHKEFVKKPGRRTKQDKATPSFIPATYFYDPSFHDLNGRLAPQPISITKFRGCLDKNTTFMDEAD